MPTISGEVIIELHTNKGNKTFRFGAAGTIVGNEIRAVLTGGGEEKLPWPMGRLTYRAVEGSVVSLDIITPTEEVSR